MHTGEKFKMPLAMACGHPLIDLTFFNISIGWEQKTTQLRFNIGNAYFLEMKGANTPFKQNKKQ